MTPRLKLLTLIIFNLIGCYFIIDSYLYHQRDSPGCQMSYSRPSFYPISVPHSKFSTKYHLYLYREGGIDNTEQLTGVPTLFIPGHAGSYKQARSIAAESAYYVQGLSEKEFRSGLDVFTVDLNEEFSGIYGKLILDQAEYLNDALQHILSLYSPLSHYHGRPAPVSVLVIGHSMGGIVAKIMPTLPNYKKGSINTIFTLATPHSLPPILLDSTMDTLYKSYLLNSPNDIAVISIAGGTLDTIINSDAVVLPNNNYSTTLSIFSTAIPDVWTGCDHMAILWCNQLVRRVAAALVDITDVRLPGQTLPLNQRMDMFKKILLQVNPTLISTEKKKVKKSSHQIDINEQHIIQPNDGQQMKYYFNKDGKNSNDFGILTNLQDVDILKIYLCHESNNENNNDNNDEDEQTYQCVQIQSGFQKLPSATSGQINVFDTQSPFNMLKLDDSTWKQYDMVIMELDGKVNNNGIFIQTGWIVKREINDSLFHIAFHGGVAFDVDQQQKQQGHLLASTFHITSISSPYLSFKLKMKKRNTDFSGNPIYNALIQQQFYGESKYHIINLNNDNINKKDDHSVSLHFHRIPLSSSRHDGDSMDFNGLVLTIWASFDDDYSIQLELDWYGSIGKLALRIAPVLPPCLFVVALSYLLSILHVLYHYEQSHENHISNRFLRNINNNSSDHLITWLFHTSNTNGALFSIFSLCLFILSAGWIQQQLLKTEGTDQILWWIHSFLLGGGKLSSTLPPFLWWVAIVPYLLATGLFLTLFMIFSFLLHLLVALRVHIISFKMASIPTIYKLSFYMALFSTLPWLPISVIAMIIYIGWLLSCTRYYSIAKTKNQVSDWLQYRYQFGLFMLLTAYLPYQVPEVIVFIRDCMIGWHYKASTTMIMKNIPAICGLIILLFIADRNYIWKSRYSFILIYAGHCIMIYSTLFGIQSPFIFQDIWNSLMIKFNI
ncbi:PGAP1-like protein-domain-containing protein [Cunninghamella echinulata]|nr:PGAP1-like protein-domain-containing protein [Cunninghamella echinulata]